MHVEHVSSSVAFAIVPDDDVECVKAPDETSVHSAPACSQFLENKKRSKIFYTCAVERSTVVVHKYLDSERIAS